MSNLATQVDAAVRAAEAADQMADMYISAAEQKWAKVAKLIEGANHCQQKKDVQAKLYNHYQKRLAHI